MSLPGALGHLCTVSEKLQPPLCCAGGGKMEGFRDAHSTVEEMQQNPYEATFFLMFLIAYKRIKGKCSCSELLTFISIPFQSGVFSLIELYQKLP